MSEAQTKEVVEQEPKYRGRSIALRFPHEWQKKEIEEEARKAGRSINGYLIWELGKRRKWKDRDPATGERPAVQT